MQDEEFITSKLAEKKAKDFLYFAKDNCMFEGDGGRISQCGNKTVDIRWKNDRFELLLNIKEDSNIAGFYGDDWPKLDQSIKGNLDLNKSNVWFWSWIEMMNQ